MMQNFSVLMSVYKKEKPEYCRACFESLLKQTVTAAEWVIVEDGPLTNELYGVLDEYEEKYPNLIVRVPLACNVGLGMALREGILHCSNELVARMDTDDIAREDRFEKQLAMFERNPELDICGSHIKEFDISIDNILSERKVPINESEMKIYQKKRDAFNHMTVMYKREAVLKAGNYQDCSLMEDTLLWVNMMLTGARCANIDDYLVFARTGRNMFERRGGLSYYKKYKHGRREVYKTGYISWLEYQYTLIVQFIIAVIPNRMRGWVYKTLLRK